MAITYNWTINPLEAYPTGSAGETDVVFTAHWQYHATEEVEGKLYSATAIGTQMIEITSGSTFTPFEQLTLEQVIGWVTSSMGEERVAAMQAGLTKQIENQINPPVVVLQSPWLNQPTGSL